MYFNPPSISMRSRHRDGEQRHSGGGCAQARATRTCQVQSFRYLRPWIFNSPFLSPPRALLLQLHLLPPKSILYIAYLITLYEAFLCIEQHLDCGGGTFKLSPKTMWMGPASKMEPPSVSMPDPSSFPENSLRQKNGRISGSTTEM